MTYRESRYITCGRSASSVGIESDERDLGSQQMTIQGRRRSGRWRFKSVAATTDLDNGDVNPSESGRAKSRDINETKREYC